MVIGMSHNDRIKLLAERDVKKVGNRKKRTSLLSKKSKSNALKQFEENTSAQAREEDIAIDEHVKMNDNYMRTGRYQPKKK